MRALAAAFIVTVLAPPAQADVFVWQGRVETEAKGLTAANASDRVSALHRLSSLPALWTRRHLFTALTDSSSSVRIAAATALAAQDDARVIPHLVRWLSSPASELQLAAAQGLAVLRAEAAIPALIRALGDTDANVRRAAISALAGIQSIAAVVPIIARLEDVEAGVRKAAVEALPTIGDARAIVPLVALFQDAEPGIPEAAIAAVGRLGDSGAIPALLRVIDTPKLRGAAAAALGQLGEVRAIGPLIAGLSSGQWSREHASKAAYGLGQIAAAHPNSSAAATATRALAQALDHSQLGRAAKEALRVAGLAAVPALLATLDGNSRSSAVDAVELLMTRVDSRATPALIRELARGRAPRKNTLAALAETQSPDAFVAIATQFRDPDTAVRLEALRALEPMLNPGAAGAAIIADLLRDSDEEIRVLAARYIGKLGQPIAEQRLIAMASPRSAPRSRVAAMWALGKIRSSSALPVLLAALSEDDHRVRRFAADALANIADNSSRDKLLAVASSPPARGRLDAMTALAGVVRGNRDAGVVESMAKIVRAGSLLAALGAIDVLTATGGDDAIEALEMIARIPNRDLRRAAVRGLGNTKSTRSHVLLLRSLASMDSALSADAALALGKVSKKAPHVQLQDRAQRGPSEVAINASAAVAMAPTAQATQALRNWLRHRHPLVRGNALVGLTRLGDKSEVQTIERLAGQDLHWNVRRNAVRALLTVAPASKAIRAARKDPSSKVRAAAHVTGRYSMPPRKNWRVFRFVAEETDTPVPRQLYTAIFEDGIGIALVSDARGQATEEFVPAGDVTARPELSDSIR